MAICRFCDRAVRIVKSDLERILFFFSTIALTLSAIRIFFIGFNNTIILRRVFDYSLTINEPHDSLPEADKKESFATGADGFLHKAFDMDLFERHNRKKMGL
jgi:high-affinity nickel permease